MTSSRANGAGRRSKGPRANFTTRPPLSHAPVYEALAAEFGFEGVSDYFVALLSQYHGLEPPEHLRGKKVPSAAELRARRARATE